MTGRLAILVADLKRNEAGIAFRDKSVSFDPVVPIFLEGGRSLASIIGKATLSMHKQVIWADIDLQDHRLDMTQCRILYPHAWGEVKQIKDGVVEEMYINAIGLMVNKPQDPRIGSLTQQGIKSRRAG